MVSHLRIHAGVAVASPHVDTTATPTPLPNPPEPWLSLVIRRADDVVPLVLPTPSASVPRPHAEALPAAPAADQVLDAGHVFNAENLRRLFNWCLGDAPDDLHALAQQPELLFTYAMTCASQDGEKTAAAISAFGINHEGALVAIARACIEGARDLLPLGALVKFGIRDVASLRSLAKQATYGASAVLQQCMWNPHELCSMFPHDEITRVDLALAGYSHHDPRAARKIAGLCITDPAQLLRIAEVVRWNCAPQDMLAWFDRPDANTRAALAKIVAKTGNVKSLAFIARLQVEDPQQRFAVAHIFVQNTLERLETLQQQLQLPQGEAWRAVAGVLATRGFVNSNSEATALGFSEPADVMFLAQRAMRRGTWWGMTDPAQQRNLLKWAALNTRDLGDKLISFGALPAAFRLELAHDVLHQDPVGLARCIRAFALAPQDERALVLACARANGGVAPFIKASNITDEAFRVEAATLCAQHVGNSLPSAISDLHIADPAARAQLLCRCLETSAEGTARYLPAFDVQDADTLRHVADYYAQHAPQDAVMNWSRFAIADTALLADCMVRAVEQGMELTDEIAGRLPTTDPAWFDILARYARFMPRILPQLRAPMAALDTPKRLELAQMIARGGGRVAMHLRDLGPFDGAQRLHLAELTADVEPGGVLDHFEAFGIHDPEQTKNIVLRCVRAGGDIESAIEVVVALQDAAFTKAFALTCARHAPEETVCLISGFEFSDQANVRDVFNVAIENGEGPGPLMQMLPEQMGDAESQRDLVVKALAVTPEALCAPIIGLRDLHLSDLGQLQHAPWDATAARAAFERALCDRFAGAGLAWLPDFFEDIDDVFVQEQLSLRAAASMLVLREYLTPMQIHHLDEQGVVKALLSMHAPERIVPTAAFIARAFSKNAVAEHFSAMPALRLEHATRFGVLVRTALSALAQRGVDIKPLCAWLERPATYRTFKDAFKVKPLIEALTGLCEGNFPPTLKQALLQAVTSFTDIKNIALGFMLGGSTLLNDEDLTPGQFAERAIGLHIDLASDANVMQRFAHTFGQSRHPDSVWQLLGKAESTFEDDVKASFNAFFFAVLGGNLASLRRSPEHNPHLVTLESLRKGIVDAYVTPLPSEDIVPIAANAPMNVRAWLQHALFEQGHLGSVDLPFLKRFVTRNDDGARAMFDAETAMFGTNAANAVESALFTLLDAQDQAEQVTALAALANAVRALPTRGGEFLHDVTSTRAQMLRQAAGRSKPLEAIDTDDPHLMLRAGSDVAGSCQRLDGNAQLNKGIHGYLLHGQTRMSAIVEKPTGRIVARSMTRLLRAGNQIVMFEEPVYGDQRYREALRARNIAKAKALGVPLLTYAPQGQGTFPWALTAEGGIAAYEYSDAMRGNVKNGTINISKGFADVVWSP